MLDVLCTVSKKEDHLWCSSLNGSSRVLKRGSRRSQEEPALRVCQCHAEKSVMQGRVAFTRQCSIALSKTCSGCAETCKHVFAKWPFAH
jgi:hypothetical protein